MLFLKYLYNQFIESGRIAKDLAHDDDVLACVELRTADYSQRVRSIRGIVREILALHETAKVLLRLHGELSDRQWKQLMRERAAHSKRRDFSSPDVHFKALMMDLAVQGRQWREMGNWERFIEMCSVTLSWLSYDWVHGGLETGYCKQCVACLVPRIFKRVRWGLDAGDGRS